MSLRIDGKRLRESTGTDNKRLAERKHAQRLLDLEERRINNFVGGKTLEDLIARYKAEFQPKKKWKNRDDSIFEHLKAFFGAKALLEGLEDKAEGYEAFRSAEKPKPAPATIVKELGLLRRVCNLAIKWRWLRVNPVTFIEMPKVNNERTRYLNPEEVQKLILALPLWLRNIVNLARHTGLRRENILSLTWAQVDFSSGFLTVPVTKNGEPHTVPINATALKILDGLSRVRHIYAPWVFCDSAGARFIGVNVSVAFKRACKKAEVENLRFHDLRHDFASKLVQRGVDIYRVKGLLGHKDMRMTTRYAHLAPENLKAVSVLDEEAGHEMVTLEKKKGA